MADSSTSDKACAAGSEEWRLATVPRHVIAARFRWLEIRSVDVRIGRDPCSVRAAADEQRYRDDCKSVHADAPRMLYVLPLSGKLSASAMTQSLGPGRKAQYFRAKRSSNFQMQID